VSAPDNAVVVMTAINLALAALLLAAIVWRVGSRTGLGSPIVGAGAGFALAVALGQMGRSAESPPDSLEKRIAGIESNIAELSQRIKDTQEAIHNQNASFENRLGNIENNARHEVSEIRNLFQQIVVTNHLKTEPAPPPPPPPPTPAAPKITIASMSVAPDPDRRHKGKRVVYLTLRTVGSSPAVVTSADISFCPGSDPGQQSPENCPPADYNKACPSRNFLCEGYQIGGQPSLRRYATIPDRYFSAKNTSPFRVHIELIKCTADPGSADSKPCDTILTSVPIEPRIGATLTGDLTERPAKLG
jgi:TolA-binding protein